MNDDYSGPERRKVPRFLPYHPDDSRVWADAGRKLILTTARYPHSGYLRRVLCQIEGEHYKYAIWMENIADSERVGHPATFQGDYFYDLKEAINQFFIIAERDGVRVMVP